VVALRIRLLFALAAGAAAWLFASDVAAQETLERPPNLPGGWVGQTGVLHANVPIRFSTPPGSSGVLALPTFELSLGLPRRWLGGTRLAPQSAVVAGRPNEWEVFARYQPLTQARGEFVDLGVTAGFNGAAESFDGELALARWFGPLRLLGVTRVMSSAFGEGDARVALGAGAVVHPNEGGLPIALTGDVTSVLDDAGGDVAWSLGVQLGVSFTTHTLSFFATNTATATLQGSSRGDNRLRLGLELTAPIPAGRFLGWFVPRPQAVEGVTEAPEQVLRVVPAEIRRYLFAPKQLEILAGTTVEWTNLDDVVHTAEATDGSWGSGAIEPGESWRATFNRPGRYLYYCGPHPFMQGVIVVR
jgi:plastocyanin